jgi:hypothetical protein
MKTDEEIRKMAIAHWGYTGEIVHSMAGERPAEDLVQSLINTMRMQSIESFIHGWKHCEEECLSDNAIGNQTPSKEEPYP